MLLADGGKLLRFNLFTDGNAGLITQLQASILTDFKAICSIGVLGPDGAILIHDCGKSQVHIAMQDGTHVQLVADLLTDQRLLPARLNLKSYYDRNARYMVTAGRLMASSSQQQLQQGEAEACIGVYGLTVSEFDNFYVRAAPSLLATIPCTLYGVWEGASRITSFDARDMEPHLITRERCPTTFRAGQWCYGVYMQRVSSLEFLRAYIPEEGGIDLQYYASTTNLYDNALGAPLIRAGGVNASNQIVYTLRGACLQLDSLLVTEGGKSPPSSTLGNTCRMAPQLGLRCTLPLNNPFITDIMTSPVLPPNGLSATHTHAELAAIFDAGCPSLANTTTAGPLLYQSILANVYGKTTPVDFVELAGTLDLVYVTPTSVGLISTKRILFQDRAQPGYVRATNLIYCPAGLFGYVDGGVCAPCNDTTAAGYYVSVAWQIQCAATAAPTQGGGSSSSSSAPFETFTVIANRNVTVEALHAHTCIFTESKGVPCPDPTEVNLLTPQLFNLAADTLESDIAAGGAAPPRSTTVDLIQCLIDNAEQINSRTLRRNDPAEYNARIISTAPALPLLAAASVRTFDVSAANYSDAELAPLLASSCGDTMVRGLPQFLACAAQKEPEAAALLVAVGGSRRRRLLQQSGGPVASVAQLTLEHQGVAMGSSTTISWRREARGAWDPSVDGGAPSSFIPPPSAAGVGGGSSGGDGFPMWIGIGVGVACAVALVLLFYLIYRRRARSASVDLAAAVARPQRQPSAVVAVGSTRAPLLMPAAGPSGYYQPRRQTGRRFAD